MDILRRRADRDLVFQSFDQIGSSLDQLIFDFEEIENGTFDEEPEDITEEVTPPLTLENQSKTHARPFQSAFSTVSLLSFKSNFWKRRSEKIKQEVRRYSVPPDTERNNNNRGPPMIKVCEEADRRATIYSTVPRPPKNFDRKKSTASRDKPNKVTFDVVDEPDYGTSSDSYVPLVIIDGQKIHEYQYAVPESTLVNKEEKKYRRRSTLSRLFGRLMGGKKAPEKETNQKPIIALYDKTVPTASNDDLEDEEDDDEDAEEQSLSMDYK